MELSQRIARVIGQLKGIQKMVEEKRDCTDVLQQVSAVKKAYDRTIIQIRKALSRIKIGKYGVCERCGKFIDTDRLMVLPETTLCVDCEKKREK